MVASDRAVQDVLTGYLGAMGEAVRRAQDVVTARREGGWNPLAAMQHLMDPRRAMDPATWFSGAWPPPQPGSQAPPAPEVPQPAGASEEPVATTPDMAEPEAEPTEAPTGDEAQVVEQAPAAPAMSAEAALAEQLAAMRAQLEALEKKVAGGEGSE